MSVNYASVLVHSYPEHDWSIGETYASLEWRGPGTKPTKAALDAAWPQVEHEQQLAAVKAARQARYQTETDPLFFKAMRGEDDVTVDDWKAAVAAIQFELPYPEAP